MAGPVPEANKKAGVGSHGLAKTDHETRVSDMCSGNGQKRTPASRARGRFGIYDNPDQKPVLIISNSSSIF
jgi:hypothetical protein